LDKEFQVSKSFTKKFFAGASELLLIPGFVQAAPGDATISTWKNNKAAALSITIDDGINGPTQKFQTAFAAKGIKGTFCLNNNQPGWTVDWTVARQLATAGHEIANHTATHVAATTANFATEGTAFNSTLQTQTGFKPVSFVYPFGSLAAEALVPGAGFIAARGVGSGIESKTPADWYNLKANAIATGQTATNWNPWVDQALTNGGWLIELWHNVDNAGQWANVASTDMNTHVAYAAAKTNLWIETMGGVAKYVKERNAASVAVGTKTADSYAFTVTDNLDNATFNTPITIKIEVSGWSFASATQNGVLVDASVVTEAGKQYALVNAVPDGGAVTVQNSTSNSGGGTNSSTTTSSSSVVSSSSSGTASSTAFDDFQDGDNVNGYGGYWYGFNDSANGGKSTVLFTTTGGGYNSTNAGSASFTFNQGTNTNSAFIGVGSNLSPTNGIVDISQSTGIGFYYKGSAARFILQATNITDYDNYGYDVPASASWQYVTFNWSELAQAGWGVAKPLGLSQVKAFALQVVGTTGTSGTLSIDDVVIKGSIGSQPLFITPQGKNRLSALSVSRISSGVYQIISDRSTEISLFDMRGHKIRTLSAGTAPLGTLVVDLSRMGIPQGMYLVSVHGGKSFQVANF
jgi:oligosaccharide reducing-end xylanase